MTIFFNLFVYNFVWSGTNCYQITQPFQNGNPNKFLYQQSLFFSANVSNFVRNMTNKLLAYVPSQNRLEYKHRGDP